MPTDSKATRGCRDVGIRRDDPDAKRLRERIETIRRQLDTPPLSYFLRKVPLRQGFQRDPGKEPLDLLKDKISETLETLVGQPSDFDRERRYRQECSRKARSLRQFPFLDDSVRRRAARSRIEGTATMLERRARGIERPGMSGPLLQDDGTVRVGPLEVREYLPTERSDHSHVYDRTVLSLVAIMRRLTRRHRRYETIGRILQDIGALAPSSEDPTEAVRKQFHRANRWPEALAPFESLSYILRAHGVVLPKDAKKHREAIRKRFKCNRSPVDLLEEELFAIDSRFLPQPTVLPSRHQSTTLAASKLPAPPEPPPKR